MLTVKLKQFLEKINEFDEALETFENPELKEKVKKCKASLIDVLQVYVEDFTPYSQISHLKASGVFDEKKEAAGLKQIAFSQPEEQDIDEKYMSAEEITWLKEMKILNSQLATLAKQSEEKTEKSLAIVKDIEKETQQIVLNLLELYVEEFIIKKNFSISNIEKVRELSIEISKSIRTKIGTAFTPLYYFMEKLRKIEDAPKQKISTADEVYTYLENYPYILEQWLILVNEILENENTLSSENLI